MSLLQSRPPKNPNAESLESGNGIKFKRTNAQIANDAQENFDVTRNLFRTGESFDVVFDTSVVDTSGGKTLEFIDVVPIRYDEHKNKIQMISCGKAGVRKDIAESVCGNGVCEFGEFGVCDTDCPI